MKSSASESKALKGGPQTLFPAKPGKSSASEPSLIMDG